MPTKAAYKAFLTNPDLEFDFFLAEKLHMTVAEMRQRVSGQEHLEWSIYYARKAQDAQLQQRRGARRG